MITRREIQQIAAELEVAPEVIDHDYALRCFLRFLAIEDLVRKSWIFKGGTSLSKCWFESYRFSEDLDFTGIDRMDADEMKAILTSAARRMQEALGIRSDLREPTVETIEDDYGKESFEGKIYYQGIWVFRGDPRSIKIHVNRDEVVCFRPASKGIIHPYSDKNQMPSVEIQTYALEEIVAEKLRAFSGQRRFAIARDIFDLFQLRKKADVQAAVGVFRQKCAIKGLSVDAIDLDVKRQKRQQYLVNWDQNLNYLLPNELRCSFGDAWDSALSILSEAKGKA